MSELLTLSRSDIDRIELDPQLVLTAVEEAYCGIARQQSQNPRKVKMSASESISFAMVGRSPTTVGFKTSYTHDPDPGRGTKRYYTTLQLYDDQTGVPTALLDGARIGAVRTAAVTALLAKATAPPNPRTLLVIGSGRQGQETIGPILTALPTVTTVLLAGSHPEGLRATKQRLDVHDVDVESVTDANEVAHRADVIVGAAGPGTPHNVTGDRVAPWAVTILVGYGVDASCLWAADRVVATNAEQMAVTGTDLLDGRTSLPPVDAQLPAILAGDDPARTEGNQRIFAYNSGLVVTDIAIGQAVVDRARELGLGKVVALWS
ncbi:ornithine cyclodeaminase family protein [Gordonia insulae]|uniref:Delta(1)-pyrroline-2-carboxylate reductase n=1 Tax=Gordonia insulae TaxID=2420509 RepID=A0A3G8JMF1_9ACTN|nr:ornithine cyclodeaminase family protein [Gordonia insulae]AZG46254.1 Delta(1)-pyrroline-2-carboxylate reductase [Gordonia insulae]